MSQDSTNDFEWGWWGMEIGDLVNMEMVESRSKGVQPCLLFCGVLVASYYKSLTTY